MKGIGDSKRVVSFNTVLIFLFISYVNSAVNIWNHREVEAQRLNWKGDGS